jgi:hypothetical protein
VLDPQAAELLKIMAGAPPIETIPIAVRREMVINSVNLSGEPQELPAVDDAVIETSSGVVVRIATVTAATRPRPNWGTRKSSPFIAEQISKEDR